MASSRKDRGYSRSETRFKIGTNENTFRPSDWKRSEPVETTFIGKREFDPDSSFGSGGSGGGGAEEPPLEGNTGEAMGLLLILTKVE